jgi:sec-independent protein translocase protein TatA
MSFIPGPWELLIILAIVLVIFGAGKLPKVMGDLAKGVKTFKAGLNDGAEINLERSGESAATKPPPAEPKSRLGGATDSNEAGYEDG